MTKFAVDDEAGSEMDEGQVRVRAHFPADEQATKAVERAVCDLDLPAAWWVPLGMVDWGQGSYDPRPSIFLAIARFLLVSRVGLEPTTR